MYLRATPPKFMLRQKLGRGTLKNCAAVHSVLVVNMWSFINLDGMQRSLREQRVYGGCLGFKKR